LLLGLKNKLKPNGKKLFSRRVARFFFVPDTKTGKKSSKLTQNVPMVINYP
jgi:hypothetical protein